MLENRKMLLGHSFCFNGLLPDVLSCRMCRPAQTAQALLQNSHFLQYLCVSGAGLSPQNTHCALPPLPEIQSPSLPTKEVQLHTGMVRMVLDHKLSCTSPSGQHRPQTPPAILLPRAIPSQPLPAAPCASAGDGSYLNSPRITAF